MDEPPSTPTIVNIRPVTHGRQRLVVLSDGRELLFSDEAVERVRIAEGQAADEETLEALEGAEQRVAAHEAALRLLSHRARSERETRTRLAMRGIAPEAIDEEMTRLRAAGLLDDDKFARSWVRDRMATAPRGTQMLRYELLGRGIAPDSIDSVTRDLDDRATAMELARRKARTAPHDDYNAFVAKVGGFLRRRGFDYGIAADATRTAWTEASSGAEAQGLAQAD